MARASRANRATARLDCTDNVTDLPLPPSVPVRMRHDSWTGARQRTFLTLLAKTGSVGLACTHAGMSPPI